MKLQLRQSLSGQPYPAPHSVQILERSDGDILVVYPTATNVAVLARDLKLLRTLAFAEAFPAILADEEDREVGLVAVDAEHGRVFAAMGGQVAVWEVASVPGREREISHKIHSSLSIQESITSLDVCKDKLLIGTPSAILIYTVSSASPLPSWRRAHAVPTGDSPVLVARWAPDGSAFAAVADGSRFVKVWRTSNLLLTEPEGEDVEGGAYQALPHPKPVVNVRWRKAPSSSSQTHVLITTTSDSTLRMYASVLDCPDRLELWTSVSPSTPDAALLWLDQARAHGLLDEAERGAGDGEEGERRRMRVKDLRAMEGDLVWGVEEGGRRVELMAVVNIDRRPPTLLRTFPVLQLSLEHPFPAAPSTLHLLPSPTPSTLFLLFHRPGFPLLPYHFHPASFLDPIPSPTPPINPLRAPRHTEHRRPVHALVRTAKAKAVSSLARRDGEAIAWRTAKKVRVGGGNGELGRKRQVLQVCGQGQYGAAEHVVLFENGEAVAFFADGSLNLSRIASDGAFAIPTSFPSLPLDVSCALLLAVPSPFSDNSSLIVLVTPDATTYTYSVPASSDPTFLSAFSLASAGKSSLFLPVDPMGWIPSASDAGEVFLTISDAGELRFWAPRLAQGGTEVEWQQTGRIGTGRKDILMGRCSSVRKTALVVRAEGGRETLEIWDSKESEFSSGLEYSHTFGPDEHVNDLDWTTTVDLQSILAVGFRSHVLLLCQQRMHYFDDRPLWSSFVRVDISSLTPQPIADSIWLADGSLAVASSNQIFLYSRFVEFEPGDVEGEFADKESVFEIVARQNGPLPDYHPQLLLQCLLWEKVELVKDILYQLAQNLENASIGGRRSLDLPRIPIERFYEEEDCGLSVNEASARANHSALFENESPSSENESGFSRRTVGQLLAVTRTTRLPHLTEHEQSHLQVIAQATLDVEEQRRALDANGLRYLISMHSFRLLQGQPSSGAPPVSSGSKHASRLHLRDFSWAFHSESQQLLLDASSRAYGGKMLWPDARALGTFLWIRSHETLRAHMEEIARNQYMSGEDRDPIKCSLFYFALGKRKLVSGLWRQASWHPEQKVMLKFLSNDFNEPRWRTAALKNAFALLSKRRYDYAAAFFLLGGSLKDAVNVCIRQLDDVQLAIAIARAAEGDEGPVFRGLLRDVVIPLSFKEGYRWLGSWAFWMLNRRDMAVRILVTPLKDLVADGDAPIESVGNDNYDDPSLALLFAHLKNQTLQTVKGTAEIVGRVEFNFVLHTTRLLCRMGCHPLALHIARNWSFERPAATPRATPFPSSPVSTPAALPAPSPAPLADTAAARFAEAASPSPARRPSFTDGMPTSPRASRRKSALLSMHRRRSSILNDMDIPSEPPTRPSSPPQLDGPAGATPAEQGSTPTPSESKTEVPSSAGVPTPGLTKTGFGSLMKTAKQQTKVPDFDMSAFGF